MVHCPILGVIREWQPAKVAAQMVGHAVAELEPVRLVPKS